MDKAKILVSCNYSICDLSITVENSHGDTTIIEPPPKRNKHHSVNLEYQEQCDEFPSVIIFNKISHTNDAPPQYKAGLSADDYIKALKEWENEKLARPL